MFKNILHNPLEVTSFELNAIDLRRKTEKKLILDQDLKDEEEESALDKLWFLVSGDWLFQWKCFISNKISNVASVSAECRAAIKISQNKEIGILPPGTINNQVFFVQEKNENHKQLKSGLLLNRDYRGVNYEVWTLLKRIYGTNNQEVVRESLDIYDEDAYDVYIQLESERRQCQIAASVHPQ